MAVTRAAYKQDQLYYPLRLILLTDNVILALVVANTLLQTHPDNQQYLALGEVSYCLQVMPSVATLQLSRTLLARAYTVLEMNFQACRLWLSCCLQATCTVPVVQAEHDLM